MDEFAHEKLDFFFFGVKDMRIYILDGKAKCQSGKVQILYMCT